MNEMLMGAIATASIVTGLFFLRFWRTTRDRFFLFFALSFFIEGCNRIVMGWRGMVVGEDAPSYYLVRLIAYTLILIAILDKNRPRDKDK